MNSANLRFRILAGACGLLAAAALLGAGALYTRSTRLARGRAPVESLSALQPRPANLFGVNVALLGQAAPARQQALDTIAAAGFGWIRQSFRWEEFEPAPGRFTWDAADELVAATARSGLQLIAVLEGSPAWARPAHADAPRSAPPQDGNAFAAFAGAFAARYGDRIDVYQVWDEPNLQVGWGGEPPNAAAYAGLLAPAYEAIHTADNGATVLLAGLAPTIETGPQNVSDVVYLRQLYEQQADAYFDAVAAKPYGFATHPADRDLGPDVLNFSRMILLHEEMAAAGNGDALVWASNFGWNHLPPNWTGGVSVWDATAAADQAWRTLAAYERARAEWPWAGVLVLENYQPDAAPDDPRWGFALVGPDGTETQTLAVLRANLPELGAAAPPGVHPADTPHAQYTGNWKFSELGADIPAAGLAEVTIQFDGTDFGLIARRDNYRAYLYVEVDGRPANALPINADGEAYAVLTSGDYRPHTEVIWLARGLTPGRHTAKIRADRGWDQWSFAGYVVGDKTFGAGDMWPLPALAALAVAGLAGAFYFGRQAGFWGTARPGGRAAAGQLAAAAILAALVWAGAWLTWGTETVQAVRRYGDSRPLLVTAATIGLFYFSPQLIVTLLSLAGLFIALLLRPEFALPLAAFFTPFYLLPRPLFERAFSLVEIVVLFAGAALALHVVAHSVARARGKAGTLARPIQIAPLDWAVLAFVGASLMATLFANNRGVAWTEFRTMVAEPVVVYALFRLLPIRTHDVWRVADFWMLAGAAVAIIGLVQYFSGINLITAEGGVARLRSVYGSPNNVGLYLGRTLPIAVAVALMGASRRRRIVYAAAALAMAAALVLSFSRGALLLGIPAALAVILLFWQRRRAAYALAGLAGAGLLALIPLSRNPRFAELGNLSTGPTFFRLNLWRSTLSMIRDHPLVGVGLDNFLYEYRGRYILPSAWQDPSLSHAHNWVLDYAARLGLPGLAVAMWLLWVLGRNLWQTARRAADPNRRALAVGLLASLVDFLAHGMVDASYWFIDLAFVFMLTAGLAQWLTTAPDSR